MAIERARRIASTMPRDVLHSAKNVYRAFEATSRSPQSELDQFLQSHRCADVADHGGE